MSLLKYTLKSLYYVTLICGINVFVFVGDKRVFERRRTWHMCVRVLHGLLFLPLVLGELFLSFVLTLLLLELINHSLKGVASLGISYIIVWYTAMVAKIGLNIYISYVICFRINEIKNLLNLFVNTYDLYVEIGKSTQKPCFKWHLFLAMSCTVIYYDFFVLGHMVRQFGNYMWLIFFILSLIYTVLSSIAFFMGITLLHAFFCAAYQLEHSGRLSASLRRNTVLRFYMDLLVLRSTLERYVRPIVAVELLVNLIWCTVYIHLYLEHRKHVQWLLFILFPLVLTLVSRDLHSIEQSLGAILQCNEADWMTTSTHKFVEMFHIHKAINSSIHRSGGGVLNLPNTFLLTFMHFAFVNAIYLSSIVVFQNLTANYLEMAFN